MDDDTPRDSGQPDDRRDHRAAPGDRPARHARPRSLRRRRDLDPRPRAALRPARRARHERPRGALPQVPRGGAARTAGRTDVAVDVHDVRRAARPARRPRRRAQPERRLPRPVAQRRGGPRLRSHDSRDHEPRRLPAGRGRRAPRRPARRTRSSPSPRRSPTSPSSSPRGCCVDSWVGGDGDAVRALPEAVSRILGRTGRDRDARRPVPLHRPRGADRPRLLLPDRARGGAQAHGDVVRRCARLLRRRPAARAARDDRPRRPRGRRRSRGPRHPGAAPGPGAAARPRQRPHGDRRSRARATSPPQPSPSTTACRRSWPRSRASSRCSCSRSRWPWRAATTPTAHAGCRR